MTTTAPALSVIKTRQAVQTSIKASKCAVCVVMSVVLCVCEVQLPSLRFTTMAVSHFHSQWYSSRHYNVRLTCCYVSRVLHTGTDQDLTSLQWPPHTSSPHTHRVCQFHIRTVPAAELDRSHDQVGPCTFPDQDPSSRTNQYQGIERDFK